MNSLKKIQGAPVAKTSMPTSKHSGDSGDYPTGRATTNDAQLKALRKVQGTPVRQASLPPYISKTGLPGETD